MITDTEESRRLLLSSDEVFRRLSDNHHALDDRLKALATKPHLTDDEQLQEVALKKQKLWLKDQMETLVKRHLSASSH